MKKIDIGQNAKVLVNWNTTKQITTKEEEKNIMSEMAKKYGIPAKNIKVKKHYVTKTNGDEVLAGDIVQNANDPRFQQELMKQYYSQLDEKDKEGIKFEDIIKIDSAINAQVDYSVYNKGKRYTIKWVKWGNFLSYGPENYFDFTRLHGLVLLNGVPANKSGKSTFAYDLLHFLLFGKTNTDKAKTLSFLTKGHFTLKAVSTLTGTIISLKER